MLLDVATGTAQNYSQDCNNYNSDQSAICRS